MSGSRNRSPLKFGTSSSSNSLVRRAEHSSTKMTNYSEINIAREMIPLYEGGSRNYFIQQCEKFIDTYKDTGAGQENCSLNKLFFEICCSKLTGAARDTLVISNSSKWSKLKETLLNRFGDQRNENLLENDLLICYQLANETYDNYERVKAELQHGLEHIAIREKDETLKEYKTKLYNQKALDTYRAGLLEPYRSCISYKTVKSLEDCLVQLRDHDNHKQQISFQNSVRQRTHPKTNLINTQHKNHHFNSLQPPYLKITLILIILHLLHIVIITIININIEIQLHFHVYQLTIK